MKITAAVVPSSGRPFEIQELELDAPRSDELLIHMVGTGICHTDLHIRNSLYKPIPTVLGHEGAGVVEQVGSGVSGFQEGDHVVLSFNSCGDCGKCGEGLPAYCHEFRQRNFAGNRVDGSPTIRRNGSALFGAYFYQSSFASHALVSPKNTIKVPKDIALESLGPLGCGIQSGAGAVLNVLKPVPGSSIAIFGTGSVGLSAVMASKVSGCTTIIGIDIHSSRLSLAQELGATHVVDAGNGDPLEEIRRISEGGVRYSVEAVGNPSVFRRAIECLSPPGMCCLVGAAPRQTEVTLDMGSILFGRCTRGTVMGDGIPQLFVPRLLELHRQDRFPFDRFVTMYPFEAINQAAEDSEKGQTVKAVLLFPD